MIIGIITLLFSGEKAAGSMSWTTDEFAKRGWYYYQNTWDRGADPGPLQGGGGEKRKGPRPEKGRLAGPGGCFFHADADTVHGPGPNILPRPSHPVWERLYQRSHRRQELRGLRQRLFSRECHGLLLQRPVLGRVLQFRLGGLRRSILERMRNQSPDGRQELRPVQFRLLRRNGLFRRAVQMRTI